MPLVGLVSATPDNELTAVNASRVVGQLDELRTLITAHDIRRLYIALSLSEAQHIEALYIDLLDMNVDVVWVPDLNSMTLLNHSVSEVDGLPAIHLNESPLTSYPTAAFSKALLDRGLALMALIGFSPLLLLIAVAVKLSSPGPIIFKQARHGWNGKIINVWKFRSMRVDADRPFDGREYGVILIRHLNMTGNIGAGLDSLASVSQYCNGAALRVAFNIACSGAALQIDIHLGGQFR